MSLLASTVALTLVAAAPASRPAFYLNEGLPTGFAVDGKLDEWKLPHSVQLGAGSQVAGKSKVASPEDFSATVWAALGPEGLALAGEVRDERVLLPANAGDINADHVEVWLALPEAALPPVGFVNQFGDQLVPAPEACADVSQDAGVCRTWWKEQTERRKKLRQGFSAQYGVLPMGVTRFGAQGAAGSASYVLVPGGYRFEALIPTSAFPRSAQAPLAELRILVDVVDNDEGHARQETFLSSSPKRRFGDASTFHAVPLATPLRFGAWPDLLEKVFEPKQGVPSYSFQPGPEVKSVEAWLNPAVGYQYSPEQPSPQQVKLSLEPRALAKLGDVEVSTVQGAADDRGYPLMWLVSRKGGVLVDVAPVGLPQLRVVARPPGLHILRVYEETMRYLGTGPCGACPVIGFALTRMSADGHFSEGQNLQGFDSGDVPFIPKWRAAPDLSSFEVYGEYSDMPKPLKPYFSRYTWNAKTGQYEHTEQPFEPAPESP
ncbi:hypothetical protein P2318_32730 [Myxococcaceae bacterium GXIMD 01537]